MQEYRIDIDPRILIERILSVRDETAGHLSFFESAMVSYHIQEEYQREAYGLHDGTDRDLVTVIGILEIEPHVEHNYWVLRVRVQRELGPQPASQEKSLVSRPIDLETFREEFLQGQNPAPEVTLLAQTDEARQHFEDWFAEIAKVGA
jgi:hypothetical protein